MRACRPDYEREHSDICTTVSKQAESGARDGLQTKHLMRHMMRKYARIVSYAHERRTFMGYYADIKGKITARFESDDDRCTAALELATACGIRSVMRVKPHGDKLLLLFDTTEVRWDEIEEELNGNVIPLLKRHGACAIDGAIEVASESPTGDVMPILSRLLVENGRCRTQRGHVVYE